MNWKYEEEKKKKHYYNQNKDLYDNPKQKLGNSYRSFIIL